jgi:8-hydroxy-5-deazaflavin:NADPH oxidoreductase
MKIGILGTGRMGRKLAVLWAKLGHDIFLGSREAAVGQQVSAELGHGIQGGSQAQAADFGDILLFAFPWHALIDVQRAVGTLEGKIIIDCLNPIMSSGSLAVGHKWSAGEEIAQQFPRAQVVKAFNTLYVEHLDQPLFSGQPATLYYCSDHTPAKQVVAELGTQMGLAPADCGPLKHARYLEPLAVFWIQMAFHMGHGEGFTLKWVER